jgi:hypothetical protein
MTPKGRPSAVSWPGGSRIYTFYPTNRHLRSILTGDGEEVTFGFDGPLRTFLEWSGTVAGRVDFDYDDRFQLASVAVNGSAITLTRNNDGFITGAGAMTVARNASTGLIDETSLGSVTDTGSYNTFGEITGYSAATDTPLYAYTLSRDLMGRLIRKVETVGGATHILRLCLR